MRTFGYIQWAFPEKNPVEDINGNLQKYPNCEKGRFPGRLEIQGDQLEKVDIFNIPVGYIFFFLEYPNIVMTSISDMNVFWQGKVSNIYKFFLFFIIFAAQTFYWETSVKMKLFSLYDICNLKTKQIISKFVYTVVFTNFLSTSIFIFL